MVSLETITQKFLQTDEYLGLLRHICKTPLQSFLKDKIVIGSARYYLQVSIECCLDVANHIIASEHFRAPKDYADSFMVIEGEGLVPPELGARLRQMAKFRNRLVHVYGDIDDEYVYRFITEGLKDIEEFKRVVISRYKPQPVA